MAHRYIQQSSLGSTYYHTGSERSKERMRAISEDELEQVLKSLSAILSAEEKRKTLQLIPGVHAQFLVDSLVSIFSLPKLPASTPSWLRKHSIKYLYKICQKHMLCPQSYVLNGIEFGSQEGAGGFCDIYRGKGPKGQNLCLKVVRLYQNSDADKTFKAYAREAILWGHLNHPNIVPFYGIHYLREPMRKRVCLVSPWMDNGNLKAYLDHNPQCFRLKLIHDVASGLRYLHDEDIIHGDLKATNVLVNFSKAACIGDFGLSNFRSNNTFGVTATTAESGGFSTRWASPEILENGIVTRAGDIWAFGCVCYEILTRLLPFSNHTRDVHIMRRIDLGDLPGKHSDQGPLGLQDKLDPFVWALISERCWLREAEARPLCEEILNELERYLRDLGQPVDADSQIPSSQAMRRSSNVDFDLERLQGLLERVDTYVSTSRPSTRGRGSNRGRRN